MTLPKMCKPDENGFYGPYGGCFVPPPLEGPLKQLGDTFLKFIEDPAFIAEFDAELQSYSGRPTPLYHAQRLSDYVGATILLKREDLNHLGAHKMNNCLGQVLLAKRSGKKKIIAETGAGQHGVATAAVAARFGMECDIYMGAEDMRRQSMNVKRIEMMGARVVSVKSGDATLTAAVDEAIGAFVAEADTAHYLLGSAVGPHPYPMIVRTFQSVIGREARAQCLKQFDRLPDRLVACVGGGSNAIGLFSAFLEDEVKMVGVEAAGSGLDSDRHAATLTLGEPAVIHGMNTYCLPDGMVAPGGNHCIAAGLDYPGIGPEHSELKDKGRVQYESATDADVMIAFRKLCELEGVLPAFESSHALAYLETLRNNVSSDEIIIVNLSGRGDKDLDEYFLRSEQ